MAAQHGLHVHQMDVSSTFLNGDLSEELYKKQPEGFIENCKSNLVCKLSKAIYGLKEAPKCWNSSLDSYLKDLKFQQSNSDPCIYTCIFDGVLCVIAIYVDDIIIACKSLDYLAKIKLALSTQYEIKDLVELHYFFGVNIVQDVGKFFLLISLYMLKRYCKNLALKTVNLYLLLLILVWEVCLKRHLMKQCYLIVNYISLL